MIRNFILIFLFQIGILCKDTNLDADYKLKDKDKEELTKKLKKNIKKKIKGNEEIETNEDIKRILMNQEEKIFKKETEENKKKKESPYYEYEQLKKNALKQKIENIEKIPKLKNITKTFEENLIEKNIKIDKKKYLKYTQIINKIEFCNIDFARFIFFMRNLHRNKGNYLYEINANIVNIFWGIRISTGFDCGISFIKKDNIKNNAFFGNLSFGIQYCKNGYIRGFFGMSRMKYNSSGKVCWPCWWGITPISFRYKLTKIRNSNIKIILIIDVIFKRLITENCKDSRFIDIDKNKILPFMGDLDSPNFWNTFFDLKISLGFQYKFSSL